MSTESVRTGQVSQAVFSICASPALTALAVQACSQISSSNFEGEFQEYFSADRELQFSPGVRAAADCVALIDCERNPEQALTTMERLRTMKLPGLNIIGFGQEVESEYLLRAMRSGCNEFLKLSADAETLREALLRFQNSRISDFVSPVNAGQVIALYGVKGGVGTTTLAVHLASTLVRRHRKRTLLIDHHSELGHIGLYLSLKNGQYHFDELIRNVDRLDADLLSGFVTRHPSGLDVLTSPDSCAPISKSGCQEMQLILNFLRTQYDYILIDSSIRDRETALSILQASNEVCLVSSPDVASLRDLARRIEHLSLTDQVTGKVRIIVNRATSEDAVDAEQIQAAVRFPVWVSIPNNYGELIRAINTGEPVSERSRSPFSQEINRWAEKLVSLNASPIEQQPATKKRFSLWPGRREKAA